MIIQKSRLEVKCKNIFFQNFRLERNLSLNLQVDGVARADGVARVDRVGLVVRVDGVARVDRVVGVVRVVGFVGVVRVVGFVGVVRVVGFGRIVGVVRVDRVVRVVRVVGVMRVVVVVRVVGVVRVDGVVRVVRVVWVNGVLRDFTSARKTRERKGSIDFFRSTYLSFRNKLQIVTQYTLRGFGFSHASLEIKLNRINENLTLEQFSFDCQNSTNHRTTTN